MPARITRVRLTDYRSIAACDVGLQPLTLLVGPNGSGKSNFLDSLRFLVHSMHSPLEQVFEARLGINSVVRKLSGGKLAPRFSIQIDFTLENGTSGTYRLTLSHGFEGAFSIEREYCEAGPDRFDLQTGELTHNAASTPAFTGDRPVLVAFGTVPAFAPVFQLIAGMTFYSPNPEKMRKPTTLGGGKVLSRDASNAADVLARLGRTQPETVSRIREYLRSFNPEFQDIDITEAKDYRWLSFSPSANPTQWKLSSSDVSDGTLRAIAILLAIFQSSADNSRASLVGLEEPESNLHPAAAGLLLDALLEGSERVQILASTHSADLLDRTELPDTAILAFALNNGETIIGPIDDASKSIIRQRLYTAGELLRNNQLAPKQAVSVPE